MILTTLISLNKFSIRGWSIASTKRNDSMGLRYPPYRSVPKLAAPSVGLGAFFLPTHVKTFLKLFYLVPEPRSSLQTDYPEYEEVTEHERSRKGEGRKEVTW